MKVLITGSSGLLGNYLLKTAPENITAYGTWYTNQWSGYQLDILDRDRVNYIFDRVQPHIVIHCAANGSVDYAERDYQGAYKINHDGTKNILGFAKQYQAKFVYISTNAVFRGDCPPYYEQSPLDPINRYGSIKRYTEEMIKPTFNWLIFRPYLLYGWNTENGRKNWVTTLIKNDKKGEEIYLVDDVIWQPTYVYDVAQAIWKLIGYQDEVFNLSSEESITLYEFGLKIAEIFNLDTRLIKPIHSHELKNIAPRPHDTSYDCKKVKSLGINFSSVEEGLERMKNE